MNSSGAWGCEDRGLRGCGGAKFVDVCGNVGSPWFGQARKLAETSQDRTRHPELACETSFVQPAGHDIMKVSQKMMPWGHHSP